MRGVIAASMAVAVLVVTGGCAARTDPAVLPMAVSPRPSPPADPAVTRQICHEAMRATSDASRFFDGQLSAIDVAAARGDQVAVVAAANAIQRDFLHLAGSFATWALRPVSRRVKTALTQGSSAVSAICDESYPGTQADIARELARLSRVLGTACG